MELDNEFARPGSRDSETAQMNQSLSATVPQSEVGREQETATPTTPTTQTTQARLGLSLVRPPSPPAKEPPRQPPPMEAPPPPPPTKELPKRPPPLQLSSRPGTSASDGSVVQKAPQAPSLRAPLNMNPPTRPSTATRIVGSNKRLSWSSIATSRRPIKYGKGKYSNVELVPQPSDDPDDPLNWPQWRKELNLGALLLVVSMTGVMKTAFLTVNSELAESYVVSYTAVAALTGVPLMLSAITGFASLIAARIWGKRPLYLISLVLLFIGVAWSTNVATSYGQCMTARVFQGLGWGAFDTLVMGSIHDTYFDYERCRRVAIYSIVSIATTWGPPLIGGVASQTGMGFGLQFTVLSGLFVLAVPLITLGAPETCFDRAYTLAQTPATSTSYIKSQPLRPRQTFSVEACKDYVAKMKPHSYSGIIHRTTLLQVPRAVIAPTTALLFVATVLPSAALWGLSSSISLLFAPMPFMLSPSSLGLLLTGPFVAATATVAAFALTPAWHIRFTPKLHMVAIAAGTALAITGILTLGMHVSTSMTPPANQADADASVYALGYLGERVSLPGASAMLALLAAGLHVLDATARPAIRRSTQFTSSNLGVALRNTADMDAGAALWRTLAAGAFVVAVPNAVCSWDGLRMACVGIAVAQAVAAALVAAVWWFWDEDVLRMDGRVMRLVDLDILKTSGSFFDMD